MSVAAENPLDAPDADGWVRTGVEMVAAYALPRLDLLEDLTHPLRSRVIRALITPSSAAELAEYLDMPVTRLYHHLNRLEQLGLIHVWGTRRVGAATERRYQTVAREYTLAESLYDEMPGAEVALALGSLFDFAKLALQREVEGGTLVDVRHRDDSALLALTERRLDAGRQAEFIARMKALLDEFETTDQRPAETRDETRFTVLVAAFPTTK